MTFDLPTRRKVIHYQWLGYSFRWIGAQPFAPSKSSVSIWVQQYLATGLYTTPALSVGAALSEAGSQYSAQHWSRSLESPLRASVCKPKTLF